ncbi:MULTISPECIES: HNH endonuclease [Hymenobacter]|uniref:HNH endonuclease n=2 Tax=Hymenobacter TaxID=89966 RepID=A0A7Y7PQT1_9BACT|nr:MULTISPECIES: HNH endonuclease [Hymenobacter]NVO32334.1 HNH endonuclease [Hymenobacter lapidiphilus]NVO86191.1 HNH endonuclease [Hymenobacter terrestris]
MRCGATEAITLDHIIPRVYEGTNKRSNFQIR